MSNILHSKGTAEVFHFRIDSEYFTLYIDKENQTLAIESSLGSFGYRWTNTGTNFKKFLFGQDNYDYLCTKFSNNRQDSLLEPDLGVISKDLRKAIIQARIAKELESYEAREIYTECCDYFDVEDLDRLAHEIPNVDYNVLHQYKQRSIYRDLQHIYLPKIAKWFRENDKELI